MSSWYVSPTGVTGNTGAIGSPWDLASALQGHSGSIVPGDTIFCRGGTYTFTDTTLACTTLGLVGSGADNPDNKIIFTGYRSTPSDVSTLEMAIIQEVNTSAAPTSGATTVNGINASGSATLSIAKAAGVNQPISIGHQLTIGSGPAAGVYVITAATTLVQGANTSVSVVPNLRGATAGGETVTLKLGASGMDLLSLQGGFTWFKDLVLDCTLPLRTFEVGGPTAWSNFNRTTDGYKLINCLIRNFSGGTFNERTSGRHEIYGVISHGIGYAVGDGGGHHHYIHHNNGSSKRLNVEACVMFNDEGVSLQMYDAAGASGAEQNVDMTNCVVFNTGALNNVGSLGGIGAQMIIVGGPQEISSISVKGNLGFFAAGMGDLFAQIGQPGQLIGATIIFDNNYVWGGGSGFGSLYIPATLDGVNGTFEHKNNTYVIPASDATHNARVYNIAQLGGGGYNWGANVIYRPLGAGGNACGNETVDPFVGKTPTGGCRTLAQFLSDCGFSGDTLTKSIPVTTIVFYIRADKYDAARGYVVYYNYGGLANIPFDPRNFGINTGDTYMVHDVRNVFAGVGGQAGSPIIGPSVLAASPLPTVPNTQIADPAQSGSQWGIGNETAPPATAPNFNVFLVRRTVQAVASPAVSGDRVSSYL